MSIQQNLCSPCLSTHSESSSTLSSTSPIAPGTFASSSCSSSPDRCTASSQRLCERNQTLSSAVSSFEKGSFPLWGKMVLAKADDVRYAFCHRLQHLFVAPATSPLIEGFKTVTGSPSIADTQAFHSCPTHGGWLGLYGVIYSLDKELNKMEVCQHDDCQGGLALPAPATWAPPSCSLALPPRLLGYLPGLAGASPFPEPCPPGSLGIILPQCWLMQLSRVHVLKGTYR